MQVTWRDAAHWASLWKARIPPKHDGKKRTGLAFEYCRPSVLWSSRQFLVCLRFQCPPVAICKYPRCKMCLETRQINTYISCLNFYVSKKNRVLSRLRLSIYLPVLPMPALQCTTIGGPRGCPAHVSPLLASNLLCCCLTKDKNCSKALADWGTP